MLVYNVAVGQLINNTGLKYACILLETYQNKFMHPPTLPANINSYFPNIYQSNLKKTLRKLSGVLLPLNRALYEFNLKNLTLLGLGLIKINTVSANFNNPSPSLISGPSQGLKIRGGARNTGWG